MYNVIVSSNVRTLYYTYRYTPGQHKDLRKFLEGKTMLKTSPKTPFLNTLSLKLNLEFIVFNASAI